MPHGIPEPDLDLDLRNPDNLIGAINRGAWDQHLAAIRAATTRREQILREDLLKQVHQLYGPNATITTPRQ